MGVIPKSIKVGLHEYTISTIPESEMEGNYADVDNQTNTIRIVEGASESRQVELLIHEALHAMLSGTSYKHEEEIVTILGDRVSSFVADNPRLFEAIIDRFSDRKKSSPMT